MVDTARKYNVNLVTFIGKIIREVQDFNEQANVLYALANGGRLDGLIIWKAGLVMSLTESEIEEFCRQYGVPVVTLEGAVRELPCVTYGNYQGMRAAVDHLIEVHGYRRIGFVGMHEHHIGFQERYRAYIDALTTHGIPIKAELTKPWFPDKVLLPPDGHVDEQVLSNWLEGVLTAGAEAIVGVCDTTTIQILNTLQALGVNVPGEIALVSFDDFAESRVITPPLTTVKPSWYELGQSAVETLVGMLEGKPAPEQVMVTPRLMVRQSCGCPNPAVSQAAAEPVKRAAQIKLLGTAFQCGEVALEMVQAAQADAVEGIHQEVERLVDSFMAEVTGAGAGVFLRELDGVLRRVMAAGSNVAMWQNAVSLLRRQVLPRLGEEEVVARAENLWQQAHVIIGGIAERAQAHRQLQAERQANRLRDIETALITTFDIGELMDMLAESLPRLGIPSCYLALYENPRPYQYPQPAPEWSRLMLAYDERGRIELEPGGRRFPSRQLVPEEVWPEGQQCSFVVKSLHFQENQIGFVLFEVGLRDGAVYDALRAQISSALQGALLVQRVQARSAELARQQYVLDTFMENVPDYIYVKDLDSRITRANKAHAIKVGVRDPAEELGKTDFDFFPEEQARVKYEQEQAIIRTGQPILNIEELAGIGQWVLTTKMPLRDENGNIIGTFGVSRDITGLKNTQAALERRAAQLTLLSDVGKKIAAVLELESVLGRAAHLVQESFGYHHVALFSVDRERNELAMQARAGDFAHLFPLDHRVQMGRGMVGWVGLHGQTLLANDVRAEPHYTNYYPDLIPTQSELAVPIRVGEETVGVLDVQSPHLSAFQDNDVMVMETLADQIAVAIENAHLYEAVQRELTERTRAEEQLERYSAELTQSNEELRRFNYIVSHDLRAPLVNLKGFAAELVSSVSVMRSTFEPLLPQLNEKQRAEVSTLLLEDVPEALSFIDASVTRMDHFINALLKLSRLGRRELCLEPVNMNALVRSTLETLAHQIKQRQVQVTIGPLPEVMADRTSMEQIMGNILNNAVLYLDSSRLGEIEIKGERHGDEAIFRIRDNGRGIAQADMDKVFAPFRRAGRQDVPGEGMGLAYVQALVRRHGGRIWCESEWGVGTTFAFTIPNHRIEGDNHA
jgi:PAS domain S-box-containing protein